MLQRFKDNLMQTKNTKKKKMKRRKLCVLLLYQ